MYLSNVKTLIYLELHLQVQLTENINTLKLFLCTYFLANSIYRDETLIEKDIWRFLSIVFDLERTNQLNLLTDKDLVDLCHPIEP